MKTTHILMLKSICFMIFCLGFAHHSSASASYKHFPYSSGMCKECHKTKVDGTIAEDQFIKEQPKLCYTCHDSKGMKKHKHEGFTDSSCTDCHQPHKSEQKKLLQYPVKELCTNCHDSVGQDVKHAHKPLSGEKSCVSCHAPHSSNFPTLLPNTKTKTCLNCHPGIKTKMDLAKTGTLHTAMEFGCDSCHSSHGDNNVKILQRSFPAKKYFKFKISEVKTCFSCHENGKDFLNETAKGSETKFKDVKSNKNLHFLHVVRTKDNNDINSDNGRKCSFCHDPHATAQKHLVRKKFPFSKSGYNIKINYQQLPQGGTCTKSCHETFSYKYQ